MRGEARVLAPAKINLTLGVGGVRADGYHPLATVYQAVGLYDEVVLRPAASTSLTVSTDSVDISSVPTDGSNLALRAIAVLSELTGEDLRVAVHIHKQIPVAGGLAGGSTDAAAALVGAADLFDLGLSRSQLVEAAAQLGSDVPFCVLGGTAIGSGRGELVTPVMTRGRYWWAVVPGSGGLSTPAVYREFDRLHGARPVPDPEVSDDLLGALLAGDVSRLGAALRNDLEAPALGLRPDLRVALDAGRRAGAHGALISGSGPTTVFLCSDPAQAEDVRDQVLAATGGLDGYVVPGAVHGAKVGAARPPLGSR